MGTHILARIPEGGKEKDYSEVLLSLGRLEVIPMEFAKKIYKMAGLRNWMVHGYLEVEPKKLYQNIKKNLGDFDRFCQYIVSI